MQAKSKNLIIGLHCCNGHRCNLFQLCMDMSVWINPSLLMNIPEIIEIKEGRNIFLVRAAVWKHEITIKNEISFHWKEYSIFVVTVDAMRVVTLVCLRKCQFDTSQAY